MVHEYTPAALAGLKAGDIIRKIDAQRIASPQDFREAVAKSQSEIMVEFVRAGNVMRAAVTLTPWQEERATDK